MRVRLIVIGALALVVLGVAVDSVADPLHIVRRSHASLEQAPVSLVGDSLNVGIEPYLQAALEGWEITTDDFIGRPTSIGLERLDAQGGSLGHYVVVSLGTNDPVESVDAFRIAVADVMTLVGSSRCVVWATLHRDGDAYEPFNAVLRAAAAKSRNLRLVEWSQMLRDHPDWVSGDGVHATPDGYRARADATVDAMRSC
jgi:hypothetical protein